MTRKRRPGVAITVTALISLSVIFFAFNTREFKLVKSMDIFYNLFKEINFYYVDETDPEELINAGIEGMLETLDPYTNYIPEENMDDLKFMTTGQYGGIGALIRRAGDFTIISEPYFGFPAYIAGLMAGDTIISIDNQSIKGKSTTEVSSLLKGTPNTNLKVAIKRYGQNDTLFKLLTRQKINIDNVPYFGIVNEDIGYIRLSNFTTDAGMEVRKAVIDLKKQNADKIILDLRGNPGGLLREAVEVANVFLPKDQIIVATKGKSKEFYKEYKTKSQPEDLEIPLVVLVNRGSASASEIVAGAIQDLDRGVVIGQRTFGKGLVQTTRPLSYNSSLKVTTAKYYIPSGRCIQAIDYSHRNEDGSVGYIPDSLISEFSTINGRKVYDGGGIVPDVMVESPNPANITVALYIQQIIFSYATKYFVENDSLPGAENFTISDKTYDDFVAFALEEDIKYSNQSNKELEELIKQSKREQYYDHAKDELEALKQKLASDPEKDIYTFKTEIKDFLREEIVSRFYFQKGRIISSFKNDQEIENAFDILNDKAEYESKLEPGTVIMASTKGKH